VSASPLLLALTTATDACGVALWREDRLQVELTLHRPRRHAERLVPLVRDVLAHGEARAADLDAVALATGPGSYTGLRIGASTAKGLCAATGAALVAVPTLRTLAEDALRFAAPGDVLCAALRSRRGEVYVAAFRRRGDALDAVLDAEASKTEAAAERLVTLIDDLPSSPSLGRTVWVVGSGAPRLADAVPETERAALRVVKGVAPTAGAVARLGAARWSAGTVVDAASFEPHYLKPFHATPRRQSVFEGLS
jgi:tRNA threonylcarbamoyladenosine biosynthesis protein TsaB